jgi:3-dehydroquinate synthase
LLEGRGLTTGRLIVTDENIAAALPFFKTNNLPVVTLPPGEDQKTLATIAKLYDAFLTHGLDRGSLVIAVGGGVIGDMVGFAAATYMRGLRWVNVPTTLLSMVDASLGGKTGVDLPQGKNLVGAFYPPSLIISDPLTLQTLPRREWIGGMAEVIKHGLIDDANLFEWIEAGHTFGGVNVLEQAISVKVRVVNEDPYERGRRALLNVGHTIGHAVESASGFKLSHGESIAIGTVAETKLAKRLGLAEATLPDRVARVCRQVGLPVNARGMDAGRIRQLMSSDKKKAGKRLKFALPKRVGEAAWGIEADEVSLMETLAEMVT